MLVEVSEGWREDKDGLLLCLYLDSSRVSKVEIILLIRP